MTARTYSTWRSSIGKSYVICRALQIDLSVAIADHGEVTLSLVLGALLLGAGIGFMSGAFGKGGSAIATPLLHAMGVPAMAAVASPLPATVPATLLASRPYAHAGHVDRRVLRLGVAFGVPATIVGATLTRWIPGSELIFAADAIVLALGLRILFAVDGEDRERQVQSPHSLRIIGVVAAVGLVSGLLGNSGGFLLAPLFMRVLGMPIRRALGTSLLLATALAVPGTIVHAALGHIDWSLAVVFALGSVPLASVGARVALRTGERALTLSFGVALTTVASALLLFAR
jgi:uncharacterized membrane protein YfcA